jgi:histidinol-phosphate phosphatase family protein
MAVNNPNRRRAARYAVVVPTLGRPSLTDLLESLAASSGPLPGSIVLVDDRREPGCLPPVPPLLAPLATVRSGGGRGPAAARNTGWQAVDRAYDWVVFLDDDVVVRTDWLTSVAADLEQPADVAGVQGRITVPLPAEQRPTDWERSTKGLESGAWITADMAYRRAALEEVGGFDERFPRAFREDADLALRVLGTGARLVRGNRETVHPVRPVDRWVSVRVQKGNADDPLMRRLHGPDWRDRAQTAPGRKGRHLAVTIAGLTALGATAAGRRGLAMAGAATWFAGTAEFAWRRIAPGPRTNAEITTMLLTSAAIPPVATAHWLRGLWRHRNAQPWRPMAEQASQAVLFDRDGTLVRDVPYNGDPAKVEPMPGAIEAVRRLRERGLRIGVITNQSGIGRELLTDEQVRAVNARVDEVFGGFDAWAFCPHTPDDRCECRKPQPGMVLKAAAELGVDPADVTVIGDIGADVGAAQAAGARAVLVPTPVTRPEEIVAAPHVAASLAQAVSIALGERA